MFEVQFDGLQVGDQAMDDHSPRLVQSLIPDARGVCFNHSLKALTTLPDCFRLVFQNPISMLCLHKVHFVDKSEHVRMGREFFESLDDRMVSIQISKVLTAPAIELARFQVKYIDENSDVVKNRWPLARQINFCERILAEPMISASSITKVRLEAPTLHNPRGSRSDCPRT